MAPQKQAATAMGFLSAGSPLGGAVSGPIVGYLALAFGWRPATRSPQGRLKNWR
ncbi:hypothetical protein [Martelella alba]|uniref:hypothetical protein n=1 Tax=Martelella alba TaxID=2590451 RepID=UPI001E6588E6|nr:hypothetical protein [Martelella alba]